MHKISLADLPAGPGPAAARRSLSRALDAEHVAINHYELAPGDSFAFGYHRHADQEEVFLVLSGTATFETDDGAVDVDAREAIRFAPGEWQRGWNRGEERVEAIAVGAPQDPGETEIRRDCAACGERTPQRIERVDDGEDGTDGEALVTSCTVCGGETGRFE